MHPKCSLSELTTDQLADLVRDITSAAVSGQRAKLDLHGNDVLTRGNHVCEQANAIATVVEEKNKQEWV